MQPTVFHCTRCHAPLAPGSAQCANCGLTFDAPVPYSPAPGYAAPAKTSSPVAIVAIIAAVGCLPVLFLAAVLFPVFAKARDKARETVSMSNLKQLDLASMQFAQDHNNTLPPLDTMAHFKAAIAPYLSGQNNQNLFMEPGVDAPYALNGEMSNKSLEEINHPESVVLISETLPHSDKQIATAYVDGHVKLGPAP